MSIVTERHIEELFQVKGTIAAERNPMTTLTFYGIDAIHLKERDELLPGRLIVIEGTDSVGRSTQLHLLRPWLESSGYAVIDSEMTRSELAGAGLHQGHALPFGEEDAVDPRLARCQRRDAAACAGPPFEHGRTTGGGGAARCDVQGRSG